MKQNPYGQAVRNKGTKSNTKESKVNSKAKAKKDTKFPALPKGRSSRENSR